MRAIELFSCAGGMSEGARRAGVDVAMAFDWSEDACASYEANHGHRPVRIDVRDLLRMVRDGWRPPPFDLLVADPPCTPWSRAGDRKGLEDERDLLAETVDLVRMLRPRTYLIANVPGLDDSTHWPVVQRLIGGLARDGYCAADYARLDAADYGVPQHRVRPFWFGHLDGACLAWPSRTHGAGDVATLPGLDALEPHVSCRAALSHLSPDELGRPIVLREQTTKTRNPRHRTSTPGRPGRTVTGNGHPLLVATGHPLSKPDEPGRTVTARDNRASTCVAPWPWDRPSTTVTSRDVVPPPGHHPESGSILSQPGAIKLSEKAAAILQGFPEGWTFVGETKKSRWSQIGMAMPPPLAAAVFRSIVLRERRAVRSA